MKIPLKIVLAATTILSGISAGQAQGFGNAYFFGDSLTDCCVSGPFTNSKAPTWADQLPPAIGASYTASILTDRAVGGAQSGLSNGAPALLPPSLAQSGLLSQIAGFTAGNPSIGPRDIAGIWIGSNDIWPSAQASTFVIQPLGPQPAAAALADYIAGNVRTSVNALVGQGFRNIVLVSPYDLGQSEAFKLAGTDSPQTRALATAYSEAYRDRLANLYTPGVNTYFFDTLTLLRNVQANPALYGFDHVTAVDSCSASPSCVAATVPAQNRYVFNDFIHTTSGFDQLIARYVANSINARSSLPAQGDLGQAVGQGFSGSLLNRLDANRRLNTPVVVPGTYTADLPGRNAPPSAIPILVGNPVSLFVEGSYAGIDRNARTTPNGPNNPSLGADFAGVTAGAEYRVNPNLLIGAAFNFLNASVDLRGTSRATMDLNSYQGGVFASYNTAHFFADGAVTYGANNYTLSRPGVIDTLTAAPSGNTLTVASRIGYLFDLDAFRLGPIAELTYANVHVGSYNERGDTLLALGVRQQDFNGLTGGAGIQIRTTLPILGGLVSPFVNLTAQHDFLDGVRSITSFGVNAPALLINTSAGRRGDDVYGKVAGGMAIDLGNGLNGIVSASSTFGRSYGDDRTVSAGLRYRF